MKETNYLNRLTRTRCAVYAMILSATLSTTFVSRAQVLSIDPGNILLNAGTPGQTLDLFVNNGGGDLAVGGLQLNVQINVPNGQSATRPVITSVDILSGTVFSGDNAGLFGGKVTDYKWEIGTIADFNPPDPMLSSSHPEKVARITFNTTGVDPGNWTLSLTTGAGPTAYADALTGNPISMTLLDGNLTVVPEVNGATLLGLSLAGFACIYRRFR